jgi:hypothetical protein
LHIRKLPPQLDAAEPRDIHHGDQADVGDAVASAAGASDIVAIGEVCVENAVQALCFADVTLDGVGVVGWVGGEAEEEVDLTLPGRLGKEGRLTFVLL